MDPSVFEQLQKADWGEIGKRLVVFAERLARRYYWQTGTWCNHLAKGATPEDIVQHVITKAFAGERQWDPARGPLETWLRWCIKSVMYALYQAGNHEVQPPIETEEEGSMDWMDWIDWAAWKRGYVGSNSPPQTPEETLLAAEEHTAAKQRVQVLLDDVSDAPELERIILAILDGCEPKPRFLAEELNIPVEEVNNQLKRLRRRIRKEANQ